MTQSRIHHWKHGWIPLDDVARAQLGPHRRANLAASALLAKVSQAEPSVTATLQQEARLGGGHLEGLEHRLKTRESLASKLLTKSAQRGTTPEAEATKIGDALRYTMIFPHQSYSEGVNSTAKRFRAQGYRVDLENNWPKGTAYKGVNANLTDRAGNTFELQFHTPESFENKHHIHPDYEAMRDPSTPAEERRAAYKRMVASWNNVPVPAAITSVVPIVDPKPVTF